LPVPGVVVVLVVVLDEVVVLVVVPDEVVVLVVVLPLAVMKTCPPVIPFAVAETIICPLAPTFAFTIASTSPENALRLALGKGVVSVGSPLSVDTSVPGPLTLKVTTLFARGTTVPALSTTATLTYARSNPSPVMLARSTVTLRAAALPAVLRVSTAHWLPFL
jgi:hypothetical protein